MNRPGRSCPLSYRYGAAVLAGTPQVEVETLWVAGGLYGNGFALERLLEHYDAERGSKALVFNGDFHWFDVDPTDFLLVDEAVSGQVALRGNVETELASPAPGAGCGCGYPDWVDQGTVERSNRIIERLRAAAAGFPQALARLAALPMYLVAQVGGERVAVVHGDAESLAGWGFSQEVLATPAGRARAQRAFAAANAKVFASSHSCLPVLQQFAGGRAIVNNGAAGMPNFRGTRYGLASRISVRAGRRALYRMRLGELQLEAVPIEYDHAAWLEKFVACWPPGSEAHASYYARMVAGPCYEPLAALRAGARQARREAA